jgi:hypothetical protein
LTTAVLRLAGSIYDGFSPRGQHALADLCAEFRAAGFYAEKERRTERSLRVYPERRWRYPLLNPSFVSSRRSSPVSVPGPSVICPVYSDGDALIAKLLATLPPIDRCTYLPSRPRRIGRYVLHGTFVLPLAFAGDPRSQLIDFAPLRPALAMLQLQLSRVGL